MKDLKFRLLTFLCLLSYFVVIACWLSLPDMPALSVALSAASVVFTSAHILIFRRKFYHLYTSSWFKNLVSALVSCLLIFFILGLLNYLAFKNPISWDFSKNQYNSLTKQTKNILKSIDRPVKFYVFATKNDFSVIRRLTELYRLQLPLLSVEFIDANLRPDMVKSFAIDKIPSLVIEVEAQNGVRKDTIRTFKEEVISRSLYFLNENKKLTFYFTQGHGEIDLRSQDNEGGSAFVSRLMAQNYQVKTLSLNEVSRIPEDMDVLVVWGAKRGFFQSDLEFFKKYIDGGGRLVVALDPALKEDNVKELRLMFLRYGVKFNNNYIIDTKSFVNGSKGSVPFVAQYNPRHEMNKSINEQVFFPLVSSVTVFDQKKKWQAIAYSHEAPKAWAENNPNELVGLNMSFDPEVDTPGPVIYGATYLGEKGRIALIGNASFVTNTYKKFTQNILFAVNLLNWASGAHELISFDVPDVKEYPIFLGKNQLGVIFYFSVIFVPIALLLVSFFLYRRRSL